jgi:GNAT superfamily N-acetyltransferase
MSETTDVPVRVADSKDEVGRAIAVQVTAFAADPIMRWLWPEPEAYLRHFPELVRGFGGGAFGSESAHVTEDFSGCALWLPPGVHPDGEALDALFERTLDDPVLAEITEVVEQMDRAHPAEPHWHLAFIGSDPGQRGRGIGGALLDHTLRCIDEQGLHAYLESSNPRNVTLYERHGFEVIGEIRVGGSPPVIPMLRVPRGG